MEIKKNHVAVITYVLKDADGELIQETSKEEPFAFIHGTGQVLPAFDTNLAGKVAGDTFEFGLEVQDAYGDYDPSRIEQLDAKIFAEAPPEYIKVGVSLPMEYNGHTVFGTIVEITDEAIKMDFNHPLAGKGLHFSGEVLDVRPATQEELAHGHAHGTGGAQH
ncbi:MAG: peptidylprolyl isomerase [Bacteroidota bacterium]